MSKIDGAILAKMMENLGDEPLHDLGQVEFDDGESAEATPILAVYRDYLVIQAPDGQKKRLSRAKAARGIVDDPEERLRRAVTSVLGETFFQRAARLLGDDRLEFAIKKRIDSVFINDMAGLVQLPDHVAIIVARVALTEQVEINEIEDARKGALEAGSKGVAQWLAAIAAMPAAMEFVRSQPGLDPLDNWIKTERKKIFEYEGPHARFKWPVPYAFDAEAVDELKKYAPALARGGYRHSLSQEQRRDCLTHLFLEASPEEFDGTPPGSCGRLRQIVFGLTFLLRLAGDYLNAEKRGMTDAWGEDLAWLKERYYSPQCIRT